MTRTPELQRLIDKGNERMGEVEVRTYYFGMMRRLAALKAANRISDSSPQSEVRKALRQVSWR